MYQILVILAVLATVSAFAPTGARQARTSSLSMAKEGFARSLPFLLKPKNLDGLIGGEAEFDPLGFAELYEVDWLREAELKHGRVAMLATVGFLVQAAGIHLPGEAFTESNPIDAVTAVGPNAWAQLVVGVGLLESINHKGKMSMEDMHADKGDRVVGEFTLPIYGASRLKGKSEEYINDYKLKELNNGRLAMCAIGGMIHHQIIGGTQMFGEFPNPKLFEGLSVNMPNLLHYQ